MPNIHVLSQDTINKIAAGEVIERPMAVVKELLENAIDAGATAVTVEIKDGGTSLIRITDNGCGIAPEDIRLAFTPHATSKILTAQDLLGVSTLGFRGEALASIASVSQLEMITKTREELTGSRYQLDGGQEKELESVGCPEGTTFLVRNLFYNTPARLKFLKTNQTEAGYINGLMERLALSHPEIAFRFINQNQTKLHTSGNGSLKDVIYHIYGREIASNLLEVQAEEVSCRVEGFIGKPVVSRGNRNFMNYFINGRYIKSTTIHKAIEDAYQPYTMQHRYPFTALHFTIDSHQIDINVHPQKMEIRFTDAKGIYQSVYHAVSEALRHKEFIPEVQLGTTATEKSGRTKSTDRQNTGQPSAAEKTGKKEHGAEPFEVQRAIQEEKKASAMGGVSQTGQSGAEKVREMGQYAVEQPGKTAVRETGQYGADREEQQPAAEPVPQMGQTDWSEVTKQPDANAQLIRRMPDESKHGDAVKTAQALEKTSQETLFDTGILSEKARKECQIIGQVFNTYWILQYEDAVYMVDQHAAHEKVMYERIMKQLKEKEPMTQMLEPPVILTLSMQEQQAVEENMDVFTQLGYQIEPFGGREYAVQGVPAHLPSVGEEGLLLEIIDTLTDTHIRQTPETLLDKVASMSCKAAVKGNNRLPVEQMEELLKELMTLENPYHCPHGRPTMIKMTRQELEKKFKRIV